MKNSSILNFCSSVAAAWFSLCVIFSHVPGIIFSGSVMGGLGLALVGVLVASCIAGICSILGVLGAYALFSKGDFQVPNTRSLTAFFLKIGFWRWAAINIIFIVVVDGLAWKILEALFSSLQFVGFLPSFVAAAIVAVVVNIPTMLLNPSHYSAAYFRKSVTELAEKEKD